MKKIAIVTGGRSDYGNLRPLLKAIEQDKDFKLYLIVTGAHLSQKYGYTVREIMNDNLPIYKEINNLSANDKLEGRAESIVKQLPPLLEAFMGIEPDFVIGFGDREEPLNCAILCNYIKVPFLHISGGDYAYGNADDMIRHAISKIAHVHFVTNQESKERLIKMGEESWRVINVGLPAIDIIVNKEFTRAKDIISKFNLDMKKPTIVVLNHPVTSQYEESEKQIKNILTATSEIDCNLIVLYPNSDPGSKIIIKTIERFLKRNPHVKVFPSLHHFDFLGLLNISSCLIGNSSSGIIESAYFSLPTINVGERETGRMHGGNVVFVDNSLQEIRKQLKLCLSKKGYLKKSTKYLYGNGDACKRILNSLKQMKIDSTFLIKKNTY
jgi:GDP/UDP-N,N'-diacetylbacillosamine 2-epimerase (hydrolysing)